MKMKLLLLAVAGLHLCGASGAESMMKRAQECAHPKMPGYHAIFPDPLGLPCDPSALYDAKHTTAGFLTVIGYCAGFVYMMSGLNILKENFWKPSWNALLSFIGMGATTQEMNSDHFPTFANCIGQFYVSIIATLLTRSTIGMSVLVGACVIELWIIGGLAVLFNPDGANMGIVGFDLFKDVIFHAASITGFFFFTGFMEPPEAMIAAANAQKAKAQAAGSGQGAEGAAGAAALGEVDIAEWFLVLGLFAIWVSYTLIVFMENTCCHSCLSGGEVEDDQAKKARIEAKAGESIRGGDVENGAFPEVLTPQEQSPAAVDATLAQDKADGDAVVDGLAVELARNKSVSLWNAPESILGKIKWLVTLPFWIVFQFTVPNFRDSEDSAHYRDVECLDIGRVILSNVMANAWMILFSIVAVQWGCTIGAVLDFEYDVVGLVILAGGLSFDGLLNAMYCGWTDADTAYQISEALAAQVNNFTFTLGCILSVYMIQENEQMPIYDGLRLAMQFLACAAVFFYLFLRLRGYEATPVLGCLMVEFGIVVSMVLTYLVYEKPDMHLTWN